MANASFEGQEVGRDAHAKKGKLILLFEMSVTHNHTAFFADVAAKSCFFTRTN